MFRGVKRADGFSLVELAIIMTIIGLVVGVVLQTYRYYLQHKEYNTTDTNASAIFSAMGNHLFNFGDFPCPAAPNLSSGDQRAGKAAGAGDYTSCATWVNANKASLSGNTPYCETNAASLQYGLCMVYGQRYSSYGQSQQASFPYTNDIVLYGSIPYVSLGITLKQSLDGYGNRFFYAVSFYETQPEVVLANGRETLGAINIQKFDRRDALTPGDTNAWARGSWGTPSLPNKYMYVTFSAGKNGKGAYNADGKLVAPCPTDGTQGWDWENCNGDSTFRTSDALMHQAVYSTAPGPEYYDDLFVNYDVSLDRDKWSYTSQTAMYNKTVGSVAMGSNTINTKRPSAALPQLNVAEKYKLDVAGAAVMSKLYSDYICDATGANCFKPTLLNQTCNGQLITGIANGKLLCFDAIDTSNITGSSSCTGSNKMTGFETKGKNIKLRCQP
ncbi:MAG: type II secretion system protein [Alphaproteobacteria bacterium]